MFEAGVFLPQLFGAAKRAQGFLKALKVDQGDSQLLLENRDGGHRVGGFEEVTISFLIVSFEARNSPQGMKGEIIARVLVNHKFQQRLRFLLLTFGHVGARQAHEGAVKRGIDLQAILIALLGFGPAAGLRIIFRLEERNHEETRLFGGQWLQDPIGLLVVPRLV